MAEHVAEAVILSDAADGEIHYANRAAGVMFGYLRDELVGEPIAKLSAPIDRPPSARLAEILHSLERDGVWSGEVEQVRKDGGRLWCSVSVSAFEHPGRGTVWTSVHTDVTARRAADEALRTADERFLRLFEDSPVGIALVSAELQLIDANPALCAITGFDRGELVGRRLEDIAHPDDAPDTLARRALAGEIPQHRAESRFITKRRDVVNVARTVTVVRGPDQRPAGGLVIVDPIAGS